MSLLYATVIIPFICARDRNPRRGLKRTVLLMAVFNAVYIAALVYLWVPLAQSTVELP